jgi:hypothetical protein
MPAGAPTAETTPKELHVLCDQLRQTCVAAVMYSRVQRKVAVSGALCEKQLSSQPERMEWCEYYIKFNGAARADIHMRGARYDCF